MAERYFLRHIVHNEVNIGHFSMETIKSKYFVNYLSLLSSLSALEKKVISQTKEFLENLVRIS